MLTQTYEHPLPALELSITHLTIDPAAPSGAFTIKNTGGGSLTGHILSRQSGLTFTPNSWTGNNQAITYSFSAEASGAASTNSKIETVAYICSNGGEVALPIAINQAPMQIQTEEGLNLASIQDFYSYAQTHPAAARRLFTSSEFYMLLLTTGYQHMDIYEHLHKDANRERAMDNFFILSGLKDRTSLSLETKRMDIVLKPSESPRAMFYVQKSDSGYADAPISVLGGAPWLSFSTPRLASSDYDSTNRAQVGIIFDYDQMPNAFSKEQIVVGPEPTADNILDLNVRWAAPLELRLCRDGYRYEDRGTIEIENNTGTVMTVEVYSRDCYVRFYANTYAVAETHSIAFEIGPAAFQGAQRLLKRLPYVSTYIDIRAHCPGQVFHKRLGLTIGEW